MKNYTFLALVVSLSALVSVANPPNVVIFFTDDMGWGDAGCYGHPTIKTPHLDTMARNGMRFTQAYVASSVCTPSRAALFTGRHPVRVGCAGVFFPNDTGGLPAEERTLPEYLKKGGYTTQLIGKWHLGHLQQHLPTRHGFDHWLGLPYSNDMLWDKRGDPPLPLMQDEKILISGVNQRELTERYTKAAEEFIAKQDKETPFFLTFAYTFPHVPLYLSAEWQGRSLAGPYGDKIEEIDASVGRVMAALEKAGLKENTLVIFTSDNGPWIRKKHKAGSAGPLRDGKMSNWEGGVRVPFIVQWPGKVAAAETSHELISTLDLLPTICALAGVETDSTRVLDGFDQSKLLLGKGTSARDHVAYYARDKFVAFRKGPWKVRVAMKDPEARGAATVDLEKAELYHLERDLGEQWNLAKREPEVLAEMLEAMEAYRKSMTVAPSQHDLPQLTPEEARASLDYAK